MTTLDIILPLYKPQGDWCERIVECVTALRNHFEPKDVELTLIITNDGAPMSFYPEEKMAAIKAAANGRFIFAVYDVNHGKGYSLRFAVGKATGQYQVYTDGDFPFGWESVAAAAEKLMDGADVVMGVRGEEYTRTLCARRKFASKVVLLLNRFFLGVPKRIADTQAGMKGFNAEGRKMFLKTTVDSFVFDMEFILLAYRKKLTIEPIPLKLRSGIAMSQMSYKTLFREFAKFLRILWRVRILGKEDN